MTEQVVETAVTETEGTAPVVNTETTQAQTPDLTIATTETNPEQVAEQTQVPTAPESADAYEIKIDGFDGEAFKAENKEVLESFHAAGMTNEQVTAVAKAFDQYTQVNIEALQAEWGGDYNKNIGLASQGIKALGFDVAQADSPTFGIQLAAAIGKYIQEDSPPSHTQQTNGESIEQLMVSEAYSNANHPDHARVASQVSAYFQKQYGNEE